MYVKIDYGGGHTRTVECGVLHRGDLPNGTGFWVSLYKLGRLVETSSFIDACVDIYVMSDSGGTVEHIRYRHSSIGPEEVQV